MAISRTEAKDLPCLFNFLAGDYPGIENKAKGLVKYLPKLSLLLEKVGDSVFYVLMKKTKKKVLFDNEINFRNSGIQVSLPKHSCDFEIQVSLPNSEYESLIKKINELEQRVKAIVEIAKRERIALYDDVVKLINN
ncbi:5194_t:CDS:2, partial [Racocetra persica]